MVALTDRGERLALTREAAAALVEDLEHIRDLVRDMKPSRAEARRLSTTLRRLLVDGDLSRVAAPRIGRLRLLAHDNIPYVKIGRIHTPLFFSSGGFTVFGVMLRAVMTFKKFLDDAIISSFPNADEACRTSPMRLDNFLAQPVLCAGGTWISRRAIIKYMANYASAVHSKIPSDALSRFIARIRTGATYSQETGLYFRTMADGIAPFRYRSDELDVVLLEVFATAMLLSESPDVTKLEEIIRVELAQ